MTGKPIILSEKEEQSIIKYYLDGHSINDTTLFFKFTNKRVVTRTLRKYNIKQRPKYEQLKLRSKKIKQSNFKKYGVSNVSQLKTVKNKKANSLIEHFGSLSAAYKNIQDKGRQTCLKKYGKKCGLQVDSIKNKARQTCLVKYGHEFATQSAHCKNKVAKTCIKKYGCKSYVLTKEFHQKAQARYFYNNITFDSFPELCFYLYHIKYGINILRCSKAFKYKYNNITHYYFPDFEIAGKFYELKGPQFIKKDGT